MISVILPCYNPKEEYLRECLYSILKQSYEDYEVLLINDGSSEEYMDLFNELSQIDTRVRLINQNNKGVSETRNYGVSIAKGDFIVFVDADDLLTIDFFKEAIEIANATGADIVQGSTYFLRDYDLREDNEVRYELLVNDDGISELVIQMLDVSVQKYNGIGANCGKVSRGPWCKLIKKQIALQTPFKKDIYLGEDRIWNIEIINKCKKIGVAYRNWYVYRNHNESASHRYDDNRVKEYARYLEEIYHLVNKKTILMDHFRVLVFEVFCEVLDGHFYNISYPSKRMRNKEISSLISIFPWNEIQNINIRIISSKRKVMYFLVKYHLFTLYHCLRKIYLHHVRV